MSEALARIEAAIERAYQSAMAEHRAAVIHARRSVGQMFRWAGR